MSDEPTYRLAARRAGTPFYGLTVTQLLLGGIGVAGLTVATAVIGGHLGLLVGVTTLVGSLLLAIVHVGGEPLHHLLPLIAHYALSRPSAPPSADRHGRSQRRPPAANGLSGWPAGPWLAGIDLRAVELDAAPPGSLPTVDGGRPAVLRHRTGGAVTVVLDVRAGPFTLLDANDQHRALAAWARVLAQTARAPGVLTLGWTLHTHHTHADQPPPASPGLQITSRGRRLPTPTDGKDHLERPHATRLAGGDRHHPQHRPTHAAASRDTVASYTRLLDQTLLQQHDLRLWITIGARRSSGRGGKTRSEQGALDAAVALAARATDAGLTVHGALSTAQLTADLTRHIDPSALDRRSNHQPEPGGLAARIGLTDTRPIAEPAPGASSGEGVEIRWDAVRTGGTWHRIFWVATWPAGPLHPSWLEPLLHEIPCARTLTVALTPLTARASRRRLNHDTAAADLALQIRDRHAVRVPDQLARAHDDIRQRDAELSAGHPELAYLALVDLAASDRDTLDAASAELTDLAARAGITDLRPLHGRHHQALTATLPLGLTVRRAHPGAG